MASLYDYCIVFGAMGLGFFISFITTSIIVSNYREINKLLFNEELEQPIEEVDEADEF